MAHYWYTFFSFCFLLLLLLLLFFLFDWHWQLTKRQRKRDHHHPFSLLPLIPAYKHWHIYLQLCISDICLIYLVTTHVITRLSFDEIYPPQEIGIWTLNYFDRWFSYMLLICLGQIVDLDWHQLSPLCYNCIN